MRTRHAAPTDPGRRWWAALALVSVLAAGLGSGTARADEDPFAELEFRHIGPVGNRASTVTGVPGDPKIYYAGAASGGIFKSADGGATWEPIFDDTPASSIGSLAVAPSDPNVVWAGTGETFIRSNVSIGDGIYRSTDAGKTWEHRGLGKTGRIGRIVVHPSDPDIVFAAALGHAYGPQQERGVYRTLDGGDDLGAGALRRREHRRHRRRDGPEQPAHPLRRDVADLKIWTAGRTSGGPGSSLWVSRDGGASWERLEGNGLPKPPWGKIGLAMSAADSNRVYALIETSSNQEFEPFDDFQGVLWRSDDGGAKWADGERRQQPDAAAALLHASGGGPGRRQRDHLHVRAAVDLARRRRHRPKSRTPAGTTTTSGSTRSTATAASPGTTAA